MLPILWFIVSRSAKNRLRAQLRRLKQPRYLIATVIGVGYFWTFFGQRLFWDVTYGDVPVALRVIVPFAAGVVGVLLVVVPWVFARERTALTFSEAEIQLLFPAPVSRRSLILYKVARSLLLILLSAAISTLLFGARVTGNGLFFLVGFWLALSLLTVHEMVASFGRQTLVLQGARGVAALFTGGAAILAAAAGLLWASWSELSPPLSNPELDAIATWVGAVQATPIGKALIVFRAPLDAAFALELSGFAQSAAISAGTLFALTLLLVRIDVSFEEATVIAAERRTRAVEAKRARPSRFGESPKRSLRLPVHGRPEWAIAWKGRVAARRLFGPQLWGLLLPVVGLGFVFALAAHSGSEGLGWMGAMTLGLLASAALLVVIGPNAVRADLRMDLPQLDILKTLPLSGAQLVAGELLGPLSVLVPMQWLCLLFAAGFCVVVPLEEISVPLRLSVVLCAAVVTPPLTLLGLLVHNAAVLLFPGWVPAGVERARGFEAMGQRLLTFAGSLVVWLVGLLPALAIGGGVMFVLWITVGPIAAPFAALVVSAVLFVEAFFAVRWMGRLFERFDLSLESP